MHEYGGVPPHEETQNYIRNVLAIYRGRSQLGNLMTNAGSQPFGSIEL